MWKQPIPVKIDGLTKQEESIIKHLIMRCRAEASSVNVGGETIALERGQCYLGRYEFAEEFLLKRSESRRVYKILKKLEKVDNLLAISRHRNCSVVTVLRYDEYTSMDISTDIWRTSGGHLEDTNQSAKSAKSAKKDNIVPVGTGTSYSDWQPDFGKQYIEGFNKLFGTKCILTPFRQKKLKLRFKTFSSEQIEQALVNLSNSKFHRGDNDTNWKADPDFLIKSDEMVDKWLNKGGK
jgi:hypothetical protein